jgi:hypothetical protein
VPLTACESVGGAVVVYIGDEPTWLRTLSMSRDKGQWQRDADAIATYVGARIGRPG